MIFVIPHVSPILSPVNGTPKQVHVYDVSIPEDFQPNYTGNFRPLIRYPIM